MEVLLKYLNLYRESFEVSDIFLMGEKADAKMGKRIQRIIEKHQLKDE